MKTINECFKWLYKLYDTNLNIISKHLNIKVDNSYTEDNEYIDSITIYLNMLKTIKEGEISGKDKK